MKLPDLDIKPGYIYAAFHDKGEDGSSCLHIIAPQVYNGQNGESDDGYPVHDEYVQTIERHLRWYADGHPNVESITLIEFAPTDRSIRIDGDRRPSRKRSWHKRNERPEA